MLYIGNIYLNEVDVSFFLKIYVGIFYLWLMGNV